MEDKHNMEYKCNIKDKRNMEYKCNTKDKHNMEYKYNMKDEYNMEDKYKFMDIAIKEAKKAYDKLEVPVGAVIVKDGKVIAKGHNLKETKMDVTKHAEIIAIQKACKKLENWRLSDCEMYVTLEPCPMCAGAILNSRIKKLYIGALDEKTGSAGSAVDIFNDFEFSNKIEVEKFIEKDKCEKMLKDFFKMLRKIKTGGHT